jgi:hypothetical protein
MNELFSNALPALYSKLDSKTLEILKEFPEVSETLEEVEKIPDYWKEKVENLVGLILYYQPPLGTETRYWKQMYEEFLAMLKKHNTGYIQDLFNNGTYEDLMELLKSGRVRVLVNTYEDRSRVL